MSDVLEVGSIISGTVINIKPYGIFVSIGKNQKGLVHISQVSDEYIRDINQILRSGDKINVKVLSNEEGKVSLSIKDVPKGQLVLETKRNEMKKEVVNANDSDLVDVLKSQIKDKEEKESLYKDKISSQSKQIEELLNRVALLEQENTAFQTGSQDRAVG